MDAITLSLPQSLDISLVNETKNTILEQIQSDNPIKHIHIDAIKLVRIDTAGLQLLTAFVTQCNAKNINFSWKNINNELTNSALSLGLFDVLKLNQES